MKSLLHLVTQSHHVFPIVILVVIVVIFVTKVI